MRAHFRHHFVLGAIAAVLLADAGAARAQSLRAGEYTVRVDGDGRISIDRARVPLVTASYAGMFGRLPSGSIIYWVDARRNLAVRKVGEGSEQPRLEISNSGERGVHMRREAAILGQEVRLVHEITVPANVAGSVDTGFTLNPELAYATQGTVWEKAGGAAGAARLGAGEGALPYRVNLQKASFDGQWGKISLTFEAGEGLQAQASLLNGARSERRPGDWVQVLPLFLSVGEGQPETTYRSVCLIRFEPAPGKQYLSPNRNLLYNGDFEGWENPDLPDGWRRAPEATRETAAGMAPDEGQKWQGARSLRWSTEAGSLTHNTQPHNYLASAAMDGPYVFSVALRGEPAGAEVAIRCGRQEKKVQMTGEWQRFSVATEVKTGEALPAIGIRKLSPGVVWVDSAQLEAETEPTPFAGRPQQTVFTEAPFPKGLLAEEIARYATAPLLGGCGPEFSYYTREKRGRLLYDLNLPPERRARASLAVSLRTPDGKGVLVKAVKPPLRERVIVEFGAAALPAGSTQATAQVIEEGKVVATLRHEVVKLPPLAAGVEVKTNRLTRTLWRAGRPYLPVGSDASAKPEAALAAIRAQAGNGFNHLHLWGGFHEPEKTANGSIPKFNPEALKEILDGAHAAGVTVTINLSHWLSMNHFQKGRFTNPDISDEEILRRALEVVRLARSHPAVLGWHLIDEPNPAYCTPEWIARIYREVKREDPYHPAEINVCVSGTEMLSFLDGSDYMSIDIYPVPRAHLGLIAPHTRFMRLAGEHRPIRWWIQSWADVREPTAAEEICMAYQALVEGTRFVLFYNYRPSSYAAWAGLGQVAAEMKALAPALAAERQDLPGDDERVVASLHRSDGRLWVMAVNRDTKAVDAEWALPAECAGREVEVLFEGRRVRCEGHVLKDHFAPLARHVYRVAAPKGP